jgi:nitronate monooxygenase
LLVHAAVGEVSVRRDPRASPTGYPFQVVSWPDDPTPEDTRKRVCDLGYLRVPYFCPDGSINYRCPAEPESDYQRKGGKLEDTVGRRCLCNALLADIGHPQIRLGGLLEPPIVTSGHDLETIGRFLGGRTRYSAADVVAYLLSGG